MSNARTLGELRASSFSESRLASRRVKDEMRDNLMTRLCQHPDLLAHTLSRADHAARDLRARARGAIGHCACEGQKKGRVNHSERPGRDG